MKLNPKYTRGGEKSIQQFESALKSRQKQHPIKSASKTSSQAAKELNEAGYCILKDTISKATVNKLRKDMDSLLRDRKNLKSRDAYFAAVQDPLTKSRHCIDLAVSGILIDIGTAFFECKPAIGTTNLRKSYIHNLPTKDTQLYHSDKNSVRFIKFFFYLRDVDMDSGPFVYVKGSHNEKFKNWESKYRWTNKEIENIYGKQNIKCLTASAGDVLVANPTGFHKGLKPKTKNRMMYTVNYVIHPEDWRKPKELISQKYYKTIPKEKKFIADFLIKT